MARVLFIDDDPLSLEALSKAVEIFGHQPLIANSGQEALQIAADLSPDLIITDMRLPDIDGFQLLGKFRQQAALAQIPVVILSASPEMDAKDLARAAGAQAFVSKPIRLQTLLDLIKQYTSG